MQRVHYNAWVTCMRTLQVDASRPVSSVFKPAVYLAALEQGLITPATLLPDQPLTYTRRALVPPGEPPAAARLSHLLSHVQAAASAVSATPIHTPFFGNPPAAPAPSTHSTQRGTPGPGGDTSAAAGVLMQGPPAEGGRDVQGSPPDPAVTQRPRDDANPGGGKSGKAQGDGGAGRPAVSPRSQDDLARARAFLLADPEEGGEWTCASASCPLSLSSPVPAAAPGRRQVARRGVAQRGMHRQLAGMTAPAGAGGGVMHAGDEPAPGAAAAECAAASGATLGRGDLGSEGRRCTAGGLHRNRGAGMREEGRGGAHDRHHRTVPRLGRGWWGAPGHAGGGTASLASMTSSGGAYPTCYVL